MAVRAGYIIADPLDALFLRRRFHVPIYATYHSKAQQKDVTIEADERWLIDMLAGRGLSPSKLTVQQHGLARLSDRLIAGLKYFGVLPEEMVDL